MKILFIDACVRGDVSRTRRLAEKYLQTAAKSGCEVIKRDLSTENIQFVTRAHFSSDGKCEYPYTNELATEFASANHIVIAAPFWEFEFPAVLNCYIEMISKAGVTFKYTAHGSEGLCAAQTLTYIYTAGGFLQDDEKVGEIKLKHLSKLYGIENFNAISVTGIDVFPEKAEDIMKEAIANIK